ncbi:IS66 family transposase [Burkholderia gladioli]|uniref:IS66 family transposase n=1 Tax=Burkholderia gladioli TaxID=28095 RepID=UPI0034DB3489
MPLLDDMKRWSEATRTTLSANPTRQGDSVRAESLAALIYYCSEGRAEIDNLIAERALRGITRSRRHSCSPAPTLAANARLRCLT